MFLQNILYEKPSLCRRVLYQYRVYPKLFAYMGDLCVYLDIGENSCYCRKVRNALKIRKSYPEILRWIWSSTLSCSGLLTEKQRHRYLITHIGIEMLLRNVSRRLKIISLMKSWNERLSATATKLINQGNSYSFISKLKNRRHRSFCFPGCVTSLKFIHSISVPPLFSLSTTHEVRFARNTPWEVRHQNPCDTRGRNFSVSAQK